MKIFVLDGYNWALDGSVKKSNNKIYPVDPNFVSGLTLVSTSYCSVRGVDLRISVYECMGVSFGVHMLNVRAKNKSL